MSALFLPCFCQGNEEKVFQKYMSSVNLRHLPCNGQAEMT